MRKIEQKMLAAIERRKDWSEGNTRVEINGSTARVFLFNNLIAIVAKHQPIPIEETVRRWPTYTTISRLNALGIDVCKRQGKIILDGRVI